MGKCRGLHTAGKIHGHQRDRKCQDQQYKKAHLCTALKANPFGGASHAKGIEKAPLFKRERCMYKADAEFLINNSQESSKQPVALLLLEPKEVELH
ncbi:40s ribosomal protein s23, partial [Lynx pardinus]